MKKTVLFRIPLLGVIIAGFFLLALTDSLQAQVTAVGPRDQMYDAPAGNFVSPQLAITILTNELNDLKAELNSLTEGTAAYRAVLAKYNYFDAILKNVIEGKTVAESIGEGLKAVNADEYQITIETLLEFKELAIYYLEA
jgi:hypothetical protein